MNQAGPPASESGGSRIAALDLVRGIAVLGILAVNIAGFAGPPAAFYSPNLFGPATPADGFAFAAMLVLFEGKMRALLSIAFGASILLFVERAEARFDEEGGEDGQLLEMRRLAWLALFGYLHFLFLWWGDILFLYAVAGFAALALRQMPWPAMLIAALLGFAAWQAEGVAQHWPLAEAETRVAAGTASAAERTLLAEERAARAETTARDLAALQGGYAQAVAARLADVFYPFRSVVGSIGETLPYMLAGMLLFGSGLFAGRWSRRRLALLAALGLATGGGATLAFTLWAARHGYPAEAMRLAINHGLAVPHLLMALGYLALVVLLTPRILASRLGRRLQAAGRMALTNYIGTSLVMTALFAGWGLGLAGRFGAGVLAGFVLGGWAIVLAWSKPWLARHGAGPLERLWRRLVHGHFETGRRN